jgi:hypothetical protein
MIRLTPHYTNNIIFLQKNLDFSSYTFVVIGKMTGFASDEVWNTSGSGTISRQGTGLPQPSLLLSYRGRVP